MARTHLPVGRWPIHQPIRPSDCRLPTGDQLSVSPSGTHLCVYPYRDRPETAVWLRSEERARTPVGDPSPVRVPDRDRRPAHGAVDNQSARASRHSAPGSSSGIPHRRARRRADLRPREVRRSTGRSSTPSSSWHRMMSAARSAAIRDSHAVISRPCDACATGSMKRRPKNSRPGAHPALVLGITLLLD